MLDKRKPLIGNHKFKWIANVCHVMDLMWKETDLEYNDACIKAHMVLLKSRLDDILGMPDPE